MIVSLGWFALGCNIFGVAALFSFGGPANADRTRAQRIFSQLGLFTLLVGLGLQLASLFMGR